MRKFTQIPLGSSPMAMSRHVAFLEGNSAQLNSLMGIHFDRVRDHLGDLDAAQIRTETGVYALLGYYISAPRQGVDVYVAEKSSQPRQDLEEVLDAIGGAVGQVLWVEPNL